MDHGGGHEGMDHGGGHEGIDHGGGHEGMDHGGGHEGMDHGGGHEGMDHGGLHMHHGGEVAGLPVASTAQDRDGLDLDVLSVSLGPVLPGWPTGLVLHADLQGDVLVRARLSWLDTGPIAGTRPDPDDRRSALDHLARFLDVAGWATAAGDARRARDGLGAVDPAVRRAAQRLAERTARLIRRSRVLAWTVGDVGRTSADGSSGAAVLDRVRRWCDVVSGRQDPVVPAASLDDVAALLVGAELGTARLIVASFDLRPVGAAARSEAVGV
ncbi:hypothetical protein [Geodermatophilus sp. FMUSA9-8]|uniref:hypothetical protein n=1 Tax=Geodermatophilus sp. FMUSA9-8 TaxID=3120155 RepID=UPI00300BEA66